MKKHFLFGMIFVIFISIQFAVAQEPEWFSKIKRIVPMESTEKDVEKIFGKPKSRNYQVFKYETKQGLLRVEYSTGDCDHPAYYNVAKGIVVGLDFSLKEDFEFSKLSVDLSKFTKEYSDDTENFSYRSSDLGMYFDVYVKKIEGVSYEKSPVILTEVSLYPPKKYDHLECKIPKNKMKN